MSDDLKRCYVVGNRFHLFKSYLIFLISKSLSIFYFYSLVKTLKALESLFKFSNERRERVCECEIIVERGATTATATTTKIKKKS